MTARPFTDTAPGGRPSRISPCLCVPASGTAASGKPPAACYFPITWCPMVKGHLYHDEHHAKKAAERWLLRVLTGSADPSEISSSRLA